MQRPEYNERLAEQDAEQALNTELKALGLNTASNFRVAYTRNVMLREKQITIARVDFDMENLQNAKGAIFLPGFRLHACGVASDAEHAVTRHGQALLLVKDPNDPNLNNQRGIRVPVYNATIGLSTPAHPSWLVAGPSIGPTPTAHLVLNCSSAGSKIQKAKQVGNNTVITQGPLNWGSSR